MICSLGICDREPVRETQLKFCSAGKALGWQSFILGVEGGECGGGAAPCPLSLLALPAAAAAQRMDTGGWEGGDGMQHCPCDEGAGSSGAHVKGDLGARMQNCLSRRSFPNVLFLCQVL